MTWRFARTVLLARRKFEAGDRLPQWLSDRPMVRYLAANFPGLLRDDAAGSAAPRPAVAERGTQEAEVDAAWREWADASEQREPFRAGEDKEDSDGDDVR